MSEVGFRVCRLRRRIFVVAVCPQFGVKCRGRALRATVRVKSTRLRARRYENSFSRASSFPRDSEIVVSSGMRVESLALVAQWFEMRAGRKRGR